MDKVILERKTKAGKSMVVTLETRQVDGREELYAVATVDGERLSEGRPTRIVGGEGGSHGFRNAPEGEFVQIPMGRMVTLIPLEEGQVVLREYEEVRAGLARRAAERLAANVPGLDLLKSARDEREEYDDRFGRMMESEGNDGVDPPAAPTADLAALRAAYPRAALYLRAESFLEAANHHKYHAGREAIRILASGGPIDEARESLENWLPESATWN